ncbi:MAG TPA: hypothetical protein VK545_00500 [Streptomyces sp.]|nr:hypothetical protein [Streptomyces sp.]
MPASTARDTVYADLERIARVVREHHPSAGTLLVRFGSDHRMRPVDIFARVGSPELTRELVRDLQPALDRACALAAELRAEQAATGDEELIVFLPPLHP